MSAKKRVVGPAKGQFRIVKKGNTVRTAGAGLSAVVKKVQSRIRYGVFCGSGRLRVRSDVVPTVFLTREAAQIKADAAIRASMNYVKNSGIGYTVLTLRKSEL